MPVRSGSTALSAHLDGKGFALGALLAAAGVHREVRGGKTDVALNLTMRGASPHAWASTASGNVRAVAGPATLVNTKIDLDAPLEKLLGALNPFRATDPSTELMCAVVRLPLANGMARVDRTIAMETAKLGVSASGTLDFRNETLDLGFQPKVRKGLTVPRAGFREPRTLRRSLPLAARRGGHGGVGGGDRVDRRGDRHRRLVAPGPDVVVVGGGERPRPLPGCARRAGSELRPRRLRKAMPATDLANEVGKAVGKLFGK